MSFRLFLRLWLSMSLFLLACQSRQPSSPRIAVAANLSQVMQEILRVYEQETGQPIELVSASSGVLTAQIQQGAPFEAFFSADRSYPQHLFELGLTQGPPLTLVYGQLVLWSRSPMESPPSAYLLTADLRSLAIAQPELAPYGQVAMDWLGEQRVLSELEDRLVFGESIGQVNQYIYGKSVDAAITAISAKYAPSLADIGHWSEPLNSTSQGIPHALVLLSTASEEMVNFLQKAQARAIFVRYGYLLPT
jgi:molybdate transport system substrate-binding protein